MTSPLGGPWQGYLNKRLLGLLSWGLRRHRLHREAVLSALMDDLRSLGPDHIAVTGDITNLGLERELSEGLEWLRRLGSPMDISVIPGNHDRYVAATGGGPEERWAPYLSGDPAERGEAGSPFPFARVRGEVVLLGLDSAEPSPPGFATGRLGEAQRARLESALRAYGERGLFRVVLVHHSPLASGVRWRRRLVDAGPFREALARAGAELVLYGHRHVQSLDWLDGRAGKIPVVGVPSASYTGTEASRRARCHVYRIRRSRDGGGHAVEMGVRAYDGATGRVRAEEGFALEPRP